MLWTVWPGPVLCIKQAGAHNALQLQLLLQAAESQAGAQPGLCDRAVDVRLKITFLTEEEVGLRSWWEVIERLHQTNISLGRKIFSNY